MDTPAAIMYASVVSQESVRIDLILAALKNMDIFYANVQNEYLNSPPCSKKKQNSVNTRIEYLL